MTLSVKHLIKLGSILLFLGGNKVCSGSLDSLTILSSLYLYDFLLTHGASNLTFFFCPVCLGCISVDECGDRLFLSDVNHHRIVVFNGNGKLLDAVCVRFSLITFNL